MIDDALAGKIDMIITKSLSRFARNTVDTLNTIRKLKVAGIGVYFEKEDIDTLDAKKTLVPQFSTWAKSANSLPLSTVMVLKT